MSPRRAALVSMTALTLLACGDRSRSSGNQAPSALATAPSPSSPPAPSAAAARSTSDARDAEKRDPAPSSAPASEIAPGSVGTGAGDCRVIRGPVKLVTTGAVLIGPASGGLASFATNKLGAPAWETPKFPEPAKQGSPALLPKPGPQASSPLASPGRSVGTASPGGVPARAASSPSATAPPPASAGPTSSASSGPTSSASAAPSSSASPAASDEDRSRLPACAVAGGFTFCSDAEGQIHRRGPSGDEDKIVAKGRRSTPVSAASLAGHTYYAFLANQRTTEGVIVRAFIGVDDEIPIPLSEEGSGATFVGLVARGADVLAMYIDARSALTPIHARTLRYEARLVRGNDAVIFIGGSTDGHVRGTLGRAATGPTYVFVTGNHEDSRYGVVAVAIDGEPKDDLPGKWSFYPAAITTSPLAATSGKTPLRLARVRPENKDSGADQVIELGHVGEGGAFAEKCLIAKAASFSDVGVAVDETGSLWVSYTNGQGTWVEQRGEPR